MYKLFLKLSKKPFWGDRRMLLVLSYDVPADKALEAAKKLFSSLQENHADTISSVRVRWSDQYSASFTLRAQGYTISGTMHVYQGEIRVSSELPLFVSMYSSEIQKIIRKEWRRLLTSTT